MAVERLLLIHSPAPVSLQRGGPSCCQRSCSPGCAALQGGARASCSEVLTRQKPFLKMSSCSSHQGTDRCCLSARLYVIWVSWLAVRGLVRSRGNLSGVVFLQGKSFPHFACPSKCSACRPVRTSYLVLLVMGCLAAKSRGKEERGSSSSSSGSLLVLCNASAGSQLSCCAGWSRPSFSVLARMQVAVHFFAFPTASCLCSACGPGTIRSFSSVL